MKSFVAAGLVAAVAAYPQAGSPSECSPSADGTFSITTVNATDVATKRGLQRRQLNGELQISLEDGVLTDQAGRTGYIAANYQFQFDSPVQADAITQEGFSLCSNGSMALDGSSVFYQCQSGSFYNLYSQSLGEQCIQIHMQALMSLENPDSPVTQIPDGQPQASQPAVTQISDGQPQASAPVVTQISDGQPQASAPVVTQISDGQPQASAPVVTQISDGQPQASAPIGNLTASGTGPPIAEYTGAAATGAMSVGALAAGLGALVAFL